MNVDPNERARQLRRLAVPVWLCGWLLLAGAAATRAEPSTIGIDEIERGQRGYGLTVFAGTEPERFDVEVIGVMRNVSPDRSWILARLSGHGLEESGVAQGMSGSPVYLDGRLAGAVAFSWSFAAEPIAGITPIGEMRLLATEAAAPAAARSAGPVADLDRIASLDLPPELLATELRKLQPTLMEGAGSALAWTAAGFGEPGRELLTEALGGLAPSGRSGAAGSGGDADSVLENGGPVAIVLMDGDLHLAATGTVTEVEGETVLALGHSLLGFGPVDLPMATAEVLTVMPSLATSFKVSNVGQVIGSVSQDREAGVYGRVGAEAAMIPASIEVIGDAQRRYDVEVARLESLAPSLVGSAVLGALQTATHSRGEQAIDVSATIALVGYPELELEQSFDGAGAPGQAASYLLSVLSYLMQNTLEPVEVERIDVRLRQYPATRTATLVGAYGQRTAVRPGDRVRVILEFLAHRGSPFRHTLELDLPPDLPAGRYSLLVGDGPSIDAARLQVEGSVPRRFEGALELLRGFHSQRDLVALGLFASRGLAVDGQPLPRLPGSMRSLLGSAGASGAVPLQLAVAQQKAERLDFPFVGASRIDFEVRRQEPVTGQPEGGDGGSTGPAAGPSGEAEDSSDASTDAAGNRDQTQRRERG